MNYNWYRDGWKLVVALEEPWYGRIDVALKLSSPVGAIISLLGIVVATTEFVTSLALIAAGISLLGLTRVVKLTTIGMTDTSADTDHYTITVERVDEEE